METTKAFKLISLIAPLAVLSVIVLSLTGCFNKGPQHHWVGDVEVTSPEQTTMIQQRFEYTDHVKKTNTHRVSQHAQVTGVSYGIGISFHDRTSHKPISESINVNARTTPIYDL